MSKIFSLFLCLFLTSCSFFENGSKERSVAVGLSKKHAIERAELISDVAYELSFDLTSSKNYQGISKIHFNLKKKMPLTIDFHKGSIQKLKINGEEINPRAYNGFFIPVPVAPLKVGVNIIEISFTHDFSTNGMGLYRYEDKEDNSVYTYTNFEPYFANHMFPCFDQPDLKASFATVVKVPKTWKVISSTFEVDKVERENFAIWTFPASQRFSTYVYALHSGNYKSWESEIKTGSQVIPLRVFARKSMAKYVKPEKWFEWTGQGFVFFEKYFGTPYAYKKYDQVIVPDFNSGAMENVGAVTFNEDRFVSRSIKSREQERRLASTILHEMAHMWFGDLVTMKWWNDLWLNESFATFAASKALSEATEFKDSWAFFNARMKAWGYGEDQRVTTHPIVTPVASTEVVRSNFDGITYGKGAAVLKQLSFYLGTQTFQKGLAHYFKKHKNENTELVDFVNAMEHVSKKDMQIWKERWLEKAMLNSIEVSYKCERGKITSFELIQTGTKDYPTLRPHKTKIALFRKAGNSFKLNKSIDVSYVKETTKVKSAIGALCPDLVYPNYLDHDYVKVTLDEKTVTNVKESLSLVDDEFLRLMLWGDLWRMVLDQKLRVTTFLEITKAQGGAETQRNNLEFIFSKVRTSLASYLPEDETLWREKKKDWSQFFENVSLGMIEQYKSEADTQKMWFDFLVSIGESEKVLKIFKSLLAGKKALPLSFKVDQDRRWALLARVAAFSKEGVEPLLDAESKKDSSQRGAMRSLYVQALVPQQSNKEKMYERISDGTKKEPLGKLRWIMGGLFPSHQKEFHKKYSAKILDRIRSFKKADDFFYMRSFVGNMLPTFCDQESQDNITSFMKLQKVMPTYIEKTFKVAAQENDRCQKIRQLLKTKE